MGGPARRSFTEEELHEGDEGSLRIPVLDLDLPLADIYLDAARWPSDDPDDPMRPG